MFKIDINKILSNTYYNITSSIEEYLPKVIWAILIIWIWIIISILFYKLIIYLFKKFKIIQFIDKISIDFLNKYKENNWELEKIEKNEKEKISDKIKIDIILAKSISYYIFLVFFRLSVIYIWIKELEIFLWDLISYLPSLFVWIIIWFFWIRFANFVHSLIYHTLSLSKQKTAKIIASWAKIIILFFTLMAVLSKIWIANEITNTILIWFISMLSIAWGLAFWLWGKEIAKEILESFKK